MILICPLAIRSLRHCQRSAIHRAGIGRSVSRAQFPAVRHKSSGLGCFVSPETQRERSLKTGACANSFFSKVRSVVRDFHTNDTATRIAVTVRHGNEHLMSDNLVRPFFLMFLGCLDKGVGISQSTCCCIISCDLQIPFLLSIVSVNLVVCQAAIFVDNDAIYFNPAYAIRSGNLHAARGYRSVEKRTCPFIQIGFIDPKDVAA